MKPDQADWHRIEKRHNICHEFDCKQYRQFYRDIRKGRGIDFEEKSAKKENWP